MISVYCCAKASKKHLDHITSMVIYTSCQYQFDIKALIEKSMRIVVFLENFHTKQLFSKRDRQLIKLAADELKLAVVSEPTSERAKAHMASLGIEPYAVKIVPRAHSERVRAFDASRIYDAVLRAFLDVYKNDDDKQACIRNAEAVAIEVIQKIRQSSPVEKLEIEKIQSQIEYSLMELSFHDVARAYVLYRDEKARVRRNRLKQLQQQLQSSPKPSEPGVSIKNADGTTFSLFKSDISSFLAQVFEGYPHLNQQKVLDETYRTIFNGIEYTALMDALTMSCRCLIESHPDYSFIAARVLRKKLLDEALGYLSGQESRLHTLTNDYSSSS